MELPSECYLPGVAIEEVTSQRWHAAISGLPWWYCLQECAAFACNLRGTAVMDHSRCCRADTVLPSRRCPRAPDTAFAMRPPRYCHRGTSRLCPRAVPFATPMSLCMIIFWLNFLVASASNPTTSDRNCENTLESPSHTLKCFVTEKWRRRSSLSCFQPDPVSSLAPTLYPGQP